MTDELTYAEKERDRKLMNMYPILEWFQFNHLPPKLIGTSRTFYDLAWDMARKSCVRPLEQDGYVRFEPELVEGLRKLLEAKDCLVRASKKLSE